MTTAPEDQSERLLPCPFCGHVGLDFSEGSTFRWLAYSCGNCGIGGETRMQTLGEGTREEWRAAAERDARDTWNARAALRAHKVEAPRLVALLVRHGTDVHDLYRDGTTKAVLVPYGQNLELDADAHRRWLWPHLGREWHLHSFVPMEASPLPALAPLQVDNTPQG
jgi:hypothetical protein